jgi:hypothetical protein
MWFILQTNQTKMATQVIQEHPGYYWEWDLEAAQWQMRWHPIHRWYSPPRLHPEIICYEIPVPLWFQEKIGLVIGRQGANFIKITEQTECEYIFYRSMTGKIEIWGQRSNVEKAVRKIKNLFWKIQQYPST